MVDLMRMPFVKGLEIGGWCRDCTHAARRLTRFSGPGHYCSANHPNWSGWQELHSRPPRSEQGRLLLTLHPEIGCQGWTRTNTVRFNKPSCYFDTTWQWRCRQEFHLHRSVWAVEQFYEALYKFAFGLAGSES